MYKMVKFNAKKKYFLAKCCVLFMLVVVAWAYFAGYLEEEYERQVLEDEARVVPGLGAGGAAAELPGGGRRLGQESLYEYGVNLSDRISYTRTLEDVRHRACAGVEYDAELPSASVVITFYNEPYSAVLRTVWSVLNATRRDQPWHQRANFVDRETGRTTALGYRGQAPGSEHVYLREVILVDDHSTLPELRGKLSHYVRTRLPPGLVRLLRLPERRGLICARQEGARAARGDALIVLDGHCEGLRDWIRPLLQRIKDRSTAVVWPVVDAIQEHSFEYTAGLEPMVGGFLFQGEYIWIEVPEHERKRRGEIGPTRSPTMSGGLFAMSRSYFWQLGGYDEQMTGWGGENLEMSFRIWQCGGTLEMVPCSRVGHLFRRHNPYSPSHDSHGVNTARMAEVWMDEYADLFYLHRPTLRGNPTIGNVSSRKALRKKLHCKSFQWFLDHVYKEKFVPVVDAVMYGRARNPLTGLCLDSMHRREDVLGLPLGFYPCNSVLTTTQHFSLTLTGQLRTEQNCVELQRNLKEDEKTVPLRLLLEECNLRARHQQWVYLRESQQLRHVESGLCADAADTADGDDARARTCNDHSSQEWTFDYGSTNSSSHVLPPDVERRLQELKR